MKRDQFTKLLMIAIIVSFLACGAGAQTYYAIDLGTLHAGSARVHGVNESGQAVGASGHPHGAETHAFFWQKQGGIRDLGTLPGGDYSSAFAINDAGVVVGTSNTSTSSHAFSWTVAQGLRDLGTLPGANASSAFAINNQGQIAGHSTASSGYEHAFMSTNGALVDLGTLGGGNSYAYGINDSGVVVGYSGGAAFVYRNGAIYDLNSMVAPSSAAACQPQRGS